MNQLGATGSAVLWAVGRERCFGIPGGDGLTAYKAVLPLDSDLLDAETEGAAVNQSGFLERGVPGPKGGKSTWSTSLTTGTILDFLEHLLGARHQDRARRRDLSDTFSSPPATASTPPSTPSSRGAPCSAPGSTASSSASSPWRSETTPKSRSSSKA